VLCSALVTLADATDTVNPYDDASWSAYVRTCDLTADVFTMCHYVLKWPVHIMSVDVAQAITKQSKRTVNVILIQSTQ
jgi:hypothetical protein